MGSSTYWTFDVAAYNALPTLEKATAQLATMKERFDKFIREACVYLSMAKLDKGELGAFLLHRHWTLRPRHLMVERPRVLESGKIALITSSTDPATVRKAGVKPSRWAAPSENQAMVALEFSADPYVVEIHAVLAKPPRNWLASGRDGHYAEAGAVQFGGAATVVMARCTAVSIPGRIRRSASHMGVCNVVNRRSASNPVGSQ